MAHSNYTLYISKLLLLLSNSSIIISFISYICWAYVFASTEVNKLNRFILVINFSTGVSIISGL